MKWKNAIFHCASTGVSSLFLAFVLLAVAGKADPKNADPLKTVEHVDLRRYAGRWFEIARIPNRFQRQCISDVTADYKLREDSHIDVVNRCKEKNGRVDEARGLARIVDADTNAKLEVSFFHIMGLRLFWGDYWIIGLGDDYDYAVVGTPNRKYGWVLSRTRALDPQQLGRISALLRQRGYDPNHFAMTRGEGANALLPD